jgi:uncharacterized protein YcbX
VAEVAALYRYPVKSFTPESREALRVLPDGRIEGDRVLALLLGDAGEASSQAAGGDWWPKQRMVTLMNTPGLARLRLAFDDEARRVRIDLGGAPLVEAGLDEDGRTRIASAVADYVRGLDEAPDLERPGRLPLRLVGDGITPRFHDRGPGGGFVSLHGRGSLLSLAEALDDPELDERRFRSNVAIEGISAWGELEWGGQRLRIGEAEFRVTKPAVRCLATHASPSEGVRDREVLTVLTRVFGHAQPSFAVMMETLRPGVIRVGDPVEVIG